MERQTVSRLLPQASLHLCIFHVLCAFSRGIAECNLNQSQRERVSEIFEQLVYAHDENEFNEARSELRSFPSAANYYNRCWEISALKRNKLVALLQFVQMQSLV